MNIEKVNTQQQSSPVLEQEANMADSEALAEIFVDSDFEMEDFIGFSDQDLQSVEATRTSLPEFDIPELDSDQDYPGDVANGWTRNVMVPLVTPFTGNSGLNVLIEDEVTPPPIDISALHG